MRKALICIFSLFFILLSIQSYAIPQTSFNITPSTVKSDWLNSIYNDFTNTSFWFEKENAAGDVNRNAEGITVRTSVNWESAAYTSGLAGRIPPGACADFKAEIKGTFGDTLWGFQDTGLPTLNTGTDSYIYVNSAGAVKIRADDGVTLSSSTITISADQINNYTFCRNTTTIYSLYVNNRDNTYMTITHPSATDYQNLTILTNNVPTLVNVSFVGAYNMTLGAPLPTSPDTTPPAITFYNMTSEGGEGCTNWNISKNNACTTSDTTPTVFIRTNISANCAIGISNLNYTGFGNNRTCSGGGTSEHTCTLINQDALTTETSYLYIGCKSSAGNENQNSTSGALKITLSTSDAETSARNAIEAGVRQALSGYTIYTGQRVYARNAANNQATGIFDKVVKWMNKVWAFNYLTENQTAAGMFNITPVLYILEMKNSSFGTINNTVSQMILDTK